LHSIDQLTPGEENKPHAFSVLMGVAGSATWRLARETNSSCGDSRKMEKHQPIAIHADMVDNQGIMKMQQTCETTCN